MKTNQNETQITNNLYGNRNRVNESNFKNINKNGSHSHKPSIKVADEILESQKAYQDIEHEYDYNSTSGSLNNLPENNVRNKSNEHFLSSNQNPNRDQTSHGSE